MRQDAAVHRAVIARKDAVYRLREVTELAEKLLPALPIERRCMQCGEKV